MYSPPRDAAGFTRDVGRVEKLVRLLRERLAHVEFAPLLDRDVHEPVDRVRHAVEALTVGDLPEGDVLVAVEYSSLNYKDAMAVTGTGTIVRTYPMVPGIDLAGTVLESKSPFYREGDKVVLTGWSVGERFWGGYTQRARVNSNWLVPLPEGLSTLHAMAIGTAFGGWRIVKTMGTKITKLAPMGGFCAETAAALSIIGATLGGIPVSTTHTIAGAIIGVGATALTDIWAQFLRLFGFPKPNWAMPGRWFAHLPRGRIRHDDIAKSEPVAGELAIGWICHYLVGIARESNLTPGAGTFISGTAEQ